MYIRRWNPVRDLVGLEGDFNRMIDRFFSPEIFNQADVTRNGWIPSLDVEENKDEFKVIVELPGVSKDDVNITFQDDTLTIEGERKKEDEKKDVDYHRVERRYGKFSRSFKLPTHIDANKIDASFKDGLLTIQLPKAEEVKPKQINVKVA